MSVSVPIPSFLKVSSLVEVGETALLSARTPLKATAPALSSVRVVGVRPELLMKPFPAIAFSVWAKPRRS